MGMPSFTATFPKHLSPIHVGGKNNRVSRAYFTRFVAANPELRTELTAEGEIIAMAPTAMEAGGQNLEISLQLGLWAKKNKTGRAFESSTGFTLPNGAIRSPDASWLTNARVKQSEETKEQAFRLICPNFVVELRSKSDNINTLRGKMKEYLANGAELGWLIDPRKRVVYVYRPERPVEIVVDQRDISADPELPGFVLDLTEIFGIEL